MANYGKYYIAVRLLLLKQYLEANAGRTRIVKRRELEQLLGSTSSFSSSKTPLKTQNRKHIITLLESRMCFLVLFLRKVGFELFNP